MPTPREYLLSQLGYHPRSLVWAKIEIVFGLLALAIGLLVGGWGIHSARPDEFPWMSAGIALALFVLGGYLALAGHRSHLYQASNEHLALLIEEIRRMGSDTQVSPQRR